MDRPPPLSSSVVPFTEIDSAILPAPRPPRDRAISDRAYDLYQQSGCVSGRDLENWFAARDSLCVSAPALAPASTPTRSLASVEPVHDIPYPHALGDQAGRAAYTLNAGPSSPICSRTGRSAL